MTGILDCVIFKNLWAIGSNALVIFLIYAIMISMPSRGLPGRHQIDGTTFTVLKPCKAMF
jgi:hypothetical protein